MKISTKKIAITAMLAALTAAGSAFRITIPIEIGGTTSFHLGNILCADITGHIHSVTRLPGEDAVNGLVLDIDMHASMVQGDNGARVLVATLKTFMQAGGQTVHYNILDTKTLRDAQLHPDRYPTLQVRRCGWNVLFKHLSKRDQDEFIRRAEMHEVC